MSSEVLARVRTFYRRGKQLSDKGHKLRSAEYYGRAAEAASSLGPDNLVALEMQRCQAAVLLGYHQVALMEAEKNDTAEPRQLGFAALCTDVVALLSTVVAALARRRVAGTLLEGKCAAVEEAHNAQKWKDAGHSAANAASAAKLYGYNTYLCAADAVLSLLINSHLFSAACSAAQFEAFAQHVVDAADLMRQAHSYGMMVIAMERHFSEILSRAVSAYDLGKQGLDARLVQLLTDAWERLQRSVIEIGRFNKRLRFKLRWRRLVCAAARWLAAARVRRTRSTSRAAPPVARWSTAAASTRLRPGRATKPRARQLARRMCRTAAQAPARCRHERRPAVARQRPPLPPGLRRRWCVFSLQLDAS